MRYAAATHVGRVRKVNQDRYLVREEADGVSVILVADGMGGHVAGEVASELAVTTIRDTLVHNLQQIQYKARLVEAISVANSKIYKEAASNDLYAGMGTTIVAVLATAETLYVAHVGDSRAYLLAHGQTALTRLTEDHSLVNELIRRGQILPEEAATHPQRHMLTRALGTSPTVDIEFREWPWRPQDVLLVCSDGFNTHVSETSIAAVLADGRDLVEHVNVMLQLALDEGGHDNITIVVLVNDSSERGSGE